MARAYSLEELYARLELQGTRPHDFLGTLHYVVYSLPLNDSQRKAQIFLDYMLIPNTTFSGLAKRYKTTASRAKSYFYEVLAAILYRKDLMQMLKMGLESYNVNNGGLFHDGNYTNGYRAGISFAVSNLSLSDDTREAWSKTLHSMLLENMGVSVRLFNCLKRAGLNTVGDIVDAGPLNVRRVNNLGQSSYRELAKILVTKYGEDADKWAE